MGKSVVSSYIVIKLDINKMIKMLCSLNDIFCSNVRPNYVEIKSSHNFILSVSFTVVTEVLMVITD